MNKYNYNGVTVITKIKKKIIIIIIIMITKNC